VRFDVDQHLDGTPAEVLGAMADGSWYEAVTATTSDWAPSLEGVETHDGVTIATVRYRFRGELNRAARAVLDPERLVHLDRVSIHPDDGTFEWDVRPEHLAEKLSVTASGRVTADGEGSRRTLQGEVKVRYPFVGGQVERAVVSGLLEHAEHERRAFPAWLAGHRP
jgi:hypothetical protein